MTNQPIRVLFFGTSSFAIPILETLVKDPRFLVTHVVTQPDKPSGRHGTLTKPPIKETAEKLGLAVLQFESVKTDEAFDALRTLTIDVSVVASFGQIIPDRILSIASHGAVNVHASILPTYRGASPIAAVIAHGEKETGITIMKMDAKMDHGPVLEIKKEPIASDDTSETLGKRLAELGAHTLPDVLIAYVAGSLAPVEQDHTKATFVKLLTREDGKLDWTKTAKGIEHLVRAYNPWPGTYAMFEEKRLKILRAQIGPETKLEPGTPFVHEGQPAIACAEGTTLVLTTVQPEGKNAMAGKAFLVGHKEWLEK
jgi:methionyl-tRNA formyltransferase